MIDFVNSLLDPAAVFGVSGGEVSDGTLLDELLGILQVARDVVHQVGPGLFVKHLPAWHSRASKAHTRTKQVVVVGKWFFEKKN